MIVTAGGTLKEKHKEFGQLLLGLGRNEMAKKEFLLSTFPTHIMKYGQLVQNLRTREDYTYADIVANIKQYAPQLVWKKNEDKQKGNGFKENPVILRTQQLTDRFGKPLDMSKSCGYCQNIKKWRGIGHTEQECKTKQRDKEGKGSSQVKGVETLDLDDHQEGGVAVSRLFIRMLKIAGQHSNQSNNRKGWYEYDTGAQTHTTNEKERLINPQTYTNGVQGHDGHITQAELIGDISLPHNGRNILLRNVLYSPHFSNLVSGLRSSKTCSLTRNGNQATLTIEDKNVYNMEADQSGLWIRPDDLERRVTILKVNSNNLQELHERYGHLPFPALKKLPEAKDIPSEEFAKAECIPCIKGKSTKPSAKPSDLTRTHEILERIYCDLIGPMETEWLGKKYVLTIIDDFSRYCIAIPIRAKSDTTETLRQAIKEIQLATGRKVKAIHADWGGEFKNGTLNMWCKSKGIIQKETVAYHSETNASIERLNRTLQDIARTAMIGAELKGLWGDAIKWAAYTKNRIPHENLTGMTPAQVFLLKEVPTRNNLRPFGQRVMVHIFKDQREVGRWAPRAQEARIIGYTETHGVYQVITPTGKRLISKDPRPIKELLEEIPVSKKPSPKESKPQTIIPSELPTPRRSTRKGRNKKPFDQREREGLYGPLQVNKLRFIANRVGHDNDHLTEQQVLQETNQVLVREWAEARIKEKQKLQKYGVYSMVPKIPEGHRPVDTKWVYDVKRDKEGNLLRRRARKVGRGFTQQYGKTYEDTYSQMARSETWRILLTLAIQHNWQVRQWDVVAAYLNAPLTHEVYVKDGEECWRLHKALYGLKQAGHEWYNTLKDIMTKFGLQQCIGDPGVFKMKHPDFAIIATHVDDMAIFAPKETTITTIELAIEQHVELEKLGIPTKLLGMELTWGLDQVKLTQKVAIENLGKEFGITLMVPTKSLPLNANDYAPLPEEETNPELQKKYQCLVGSLLYIARHTRPEISLHINLLGRRTSKPIQLHFQTAIRILRYLSSSSTDGICLRRESQEVTGEENTSIQGYADASYGGEKSLSQSGSLIKLNTQVISWTSKRQETTAQSITEAEYIACCETAKDLRWIQQLLIELGTTPIVELYTDNEAAIKLTKTQTFHRRTCHVEHKWHFIREMVDRKLLIVKGIKGKENPADPLTKLLPMTVLRRWMKENSNG